MSSIPPSLGDAPAITNNQADGAQPPEVDKAAQPSNLDGVAYPNASSSGSASDKRQDPPPILHVESQSKDTVPSGAGGKNETAGSLVEDLDVVNLASSSSSSMETSNANANADADANKAEAQSIVNNSDNDADYENAQRAAEQAKDEVAEIDPSKPVGIAEEKKINEPSIENGPNESDHGGNAPMDTADIGLATNTSAGSSSANASAKRDSALLETSPSAEPPTKKQKEVEKVASTSPSSEQSSEDRVVPETGSPDVPSILPADKAALPPSTGSGPPAQNGDAVTVPTVSPSGEDSQTPVCDPDFASRVNLDPIPEVRPLPMLTPRDVAELELALQIGDKFNYGGENSWKEDWSGNLQLIDKELIMNRDQIAQDPSAKPIMTSFLEWAMKTSKDGNDAPRPVRLLFSYVYHIKGTPVMAQKIMAHALERPAQTLDERRNHILDCIRRISYDPTVLNQDGWTTAKADKPDGPSGGAFLIGRRVVWHKYEAVIIAFVRDEDIGDMWKAMWLEDLDTFDMEADELQEALKKWEKREALKQKRAQKHGGKVQGSGGKRVSSQRFAASSNFTVDGIEHGIVLASSFNSNARHGILWPARIMHVSEVKALGSQAVARRSSSKNTVHAVFLAPYWSSQSAYSSKNKLEAFDPKAANATNPFCAGPLFEMDMIEVSETTIKKYPYDDAQLDSLSIDQLRAEFRFLGLPKAAFTRYLDSHRLATAFKSYARRELAKKGGDSSHVSAFAALTETHTLSVKTALFPAAVLSLPFEYALSKLPHPTQQASQLIGDESDEVTEPVMKLHIMLRAMTPPYCWGTVVSDKTATSDGEADTGTAMILSTPQSPPGSPPIRSPDPKFSSSMSASGKSDSNEGDDTSWSMQNFASDYLLRLIGAGSGAAPPVSPLSFLGVQLTDLLGRLSRDVASLAPEIDPKQRREKLRACLSYCLMIKGHGEDTILSSDDVPKDLNVKNVVVEWRKACERIYKRATVKFSTTGFGNGVTPVITDSRCNQHITASGSFERAVRLPAAIRGAKKAGTGSKENMPLIYTIEEEYLDLAENKILPKAHKASYLKRMKNKVANLPAEAKGVPLTDDSDGEGGEDTMGSRGSYTAAVVAVGAALKAADMIVNGQCVNAFCAVRPPGHHAGRELRPMKAISNGFCLLNAAASAALYATTPRAEGGLGLKRVCVIDFDVHHGNGTQDILCSTHDSRFLYVSLHAGGAHINGYEDEDGSDDGLYRHSLGTGKNEGIFPGRCGDTSPHEGVLNIPLGQKVTAAAIGQALVTQVSPAVESFSPELVILSAGFDAHKHDPLGMGGLSAEDFGSVTEVACQMAYKSCSGRVLSILEGGYGVPCCRPLKQDLFLPANSTAAPQRLLNLGGDLPESMEDDVPPNLAQKLDRCHAEGFMECVQHHVGGLEKYSGSRRSTS